VGNYKRIRFNSPPFYNFSRSEIDVGKHERELSIWVHVAHDQLHREDLLISRESFLETELISSLISELFLSRFAPQALTFPLPMLKKAP
jgi:hypothetical protein